MTNPSFSSLCPHPDTRSPRADLYQCHLTWKDDSTLLIGWADCIKVGLALLDILAPFVLDFRMLDVLGVWLLSLVLPSSISLLCLLFSEIWNTIPYNLSPDGLQVAVVQQRPAKGPRDLDMPSRFVELVAVLKTEYTIAGIGAFHNDLVRVV